MAESAPAEPPSRWTVVNDYSKTVVTLGAGLLGFLAAFTDKLQIAEGSPTTRTVFVVAVVFLLMAIAFALAVPGQMDRYLRICAAGDPSGSPPGAAKDTEWNVARPIAIRRCKLFANLSYVFLFLAAFALAGFTVARLWNLKPRTDSPTAPCSESTKSFADAAKSHAAAASSNAETAKAHADSARSAADMAKAYAEMSKTGCPTCACTIRIDCDHSCPKTQSRGSR